MKSWKIGVLTLLFPLLFVSFGSTASADSWLPPKTATYIAESGDAWLTVVPASRTQSNCTAQLFRKSVLGDAKSVWSRALVNRIAPMDVLIATEGRRIVSFDNYGNLGFGREVVVFYDEKGDIVKQYALEDFLSPEEIEQVAHTVSSRWWRGKTSIDEELGIVEVEVRLGDNINRTQKWIRFRLSDGELVRQ